MNREKLISYIQLINTQGIGPINFRRLLARFGSVEKALTEVSQKRELFSYKKAEEEVMTAEIKHVHLITLEDEYYPYNLKQIEDFPPILYALGNVELLKNDNALAVVGSRKASLSAQRLSTQISSELALRDIVIVSGMAKGIDAAAHKGALLENGNTIAVLGTGIDVVYPRENEEIYKKITEKGLILSEYPFHTKPQTTNFPRRNRLVSGLSKGVLVIEAGLHSGSLITVHQALEQGRDVYAVPGAPYDDRCAGCNLLIKEGAILVEKTKDILDNFNFTQVKFAPRKLKEPETGNLFEYSLDNSENNSDISENKDEYSELLSLISESGEDIDDIIRNINLPAETVMRMVVELELENKVIRLPGNKIAKA